MIEKCLNITILDFSNFDNLLQKGLPKENKIAKCNDRKTTRQLVYFSVVTGRAH